MERGTGEEFDALFLVPGSLFRHLERYVARRCRRSYAYTLLIYI